MADKYPFKRDFYEDVAKSIQENGATFVLGPRKCGKTVCLMQIWDAYENAEYVDFKQLKPERESMEVLLRIQESIEKDENKIYLLDEITYALNPEKYICEIAYLFTKNDPHNTKVVFSGSQSLALDKWGHIAFCGSAGFIRTDFLSYAEWLRYKNIEKPSAESYEQFLYETPEFCKIKTLEEYLQGCLEETALSNLKTSNYLFGNDCDLLDAKLLLDVCYATLFSLHNHVSNTTFAKDNYLKTDIIYYFEKICKELDLDKRIQDSFVGRYNRFQTRRWQELEQAFLFLKNCDLITVTPIVNDLANVPDMGLDFRLIAHGNDSTTDFKKGLFRDFNMCIKYPAFYVAILKDILKEQMPDHLPKGLLGSIVECHIRGMLPEELAAEYHDDIDNEIDYVNVVDKTAVEITISNKPIKETHFDCLPDGYKCCLLTKDRLDTIGNIQLIPYYDFINNGAKIEKENILTAPALVSVLINRSDGEPYKDSPNIMSQQKAEAWKTETDSAKLYHAVLFSNGVINDGAGLAALRNIMENPNVPADALVLTAMGKLDNQGKSMMTNADVRETWQHILKNPNCSPALAADIAIETILNKDRMQPDIFLKTLTETYGVIRNNGFKEIASVIADYLNEHMSEEKTLSAIDNLMKDQGMQSLMRKKEIPPTSEPEKDLSSQLDGHGLDQNDDLLK